MKHKILRGRGCPICGYDIVTAHRWWQRLTLRRRAGVPLTELLIQRKYRVQP